MHNTLNLARQPIIDRQDTILGYEFFYRDAQAKCSIDDARHATTSVLVNLLNQIGIASSFGDTLAFINTDGPLLLTDIICTLPKEKIVFELTSSMRHTTQIHEAIRHYHSIGYRFALDNASFHPDYLEAFGPIFQYMEFAKFDAMQTDSEQFAYLPNPYGKMITIVYKIEFYEMVEVYEKFGVKYFQGFYFAKSHLITHNRIDSKYADVLSLFSLLQTEASIEDVCTSFQRESALSLQLMQFLISTHPHHIRGAVSVKEMIERMGKSTLLQWLLLIIYSKSGTMSTGSDNLSSTYAQERVTSILKLLHLASPNPAPELIEKARLIALFSLLEKLMKIPLENAILEVNPPADIRDALINSSGLLGRIYAATLKLEKCDPAAAALLLKTYGVNQDQLV